MAEQIDGTLGDGGQRNAVGKGIQQVNVELHDLNAKDAEIVRIVTRLNIAMFGDNFRERGIVRQLDEMDAELKKLATRDEVKNLITQAVAPIERRVNNMEDIFGRLPKNDLNRNMLISISIGVVFIAIALVFIIVLISNGGVV